MQLCEADSKAILARHGISVPTRRAVLQAESAPPALQNPVVVKAQLLGGGRGRGGLVSVSHPDPLEAIRSIRRKMEARGNIPAVLIEDRLEIAAEYYLAFRIDDVAQCVQILFSKSGGIDVEDSELALARFDVAPRGELRAGDLVAFFRESGVGGDVLSRLSVLAVDIFKLLRIEDADFIEINPLVVTPNGRLVAADAKISLDDSAYFRHADRNFAISERLRLSSMSQLERDAEQGGCTCVDLGGEIALVTAGAGLGMLMIDLLSDAKLSPATFFDNSAGGRSDSTEARLKLVFESARNPSISAIAFCQMLITRDLNLRTNALLKLLEQSPPPKPLYIAISAYGVSERTMSSEQARRILRDRGYVTEELPQDLVARMASDRSKGII